ncbi:DUF433 domain-containing protein [Anabaena sphaerica]|uniref:DUF433 domain-containing protein n=1 Tax=Anabaena sphaerica TaxID=212446 RepID=UPI001F549925|nr:DUF433 domain-containing protein [Anabaena sphaerica]
MQATDIGTLIIKSSDTLGGRPRIAGTRVSVQRITAWYKSRDTPSGNICLPRFCKSGISGGH